jgi:predicted glycoside hydrolase/deacetylase ChbG (UPF0249 family)
MIIVNADDWGRSRADTDAALSCYRKERISSVSAMVFMDDSGRAAKLAKDSAIDVGLHLNLTEPFTGGSPDKLLNEYHNRIARFLTFNKYSSLIYNPNLRKQFQYVYKAQVDEFIRLYERPPSHINGHHHQHLCANILLDRIISRGQKVRRNFSFRWRDKNPINFVYRRLLDRLLARRYYLTDFFFSLSWCLETGQTMRVAHLAKASTVELATHPRIATEYAYLMSDDYLAMLHQLEEGTYTVLNLSNGCTDRPSRPHMTGK